MNRQRVRPFGAIREMLAPQLAGRATSHVGELVSYSRLLVTFRGLMGLLILLDLMNLNLI